MDDGERADERRGAGTAGLAGRTVPEAVESVLARDESRDPEVVRATLEEISEDGVVSRSALTDELGRVSKVVSTPETRVELAADALSEARAAAAAVAEFDAVQAKLDGYESELEAIQREVDQLSTELRDIVDARSDRSLYETARALEELATAANEAAQAADTLTFSLEEFEHWLDSPAARFDELAADAEDLEQSVANLADLVDELETAVEQGSSGDFGPDWAVLTVRRRVFALMLADLRAELASLRRWHDREGIDHGERADRLRERLGGLEESLSTLEERLSAHEHGWADRFEEELASFERAVADVEPPVDWAAIQPMVESHYEAIEDRRDE